MSAFNKAQFNLAFFNTRNEGVIWFSLDYKEQVDSIILTSSTLYAQLLGSESVGNSGIEWGRGHMFSAASEENVDLQNAEACAFFKASSSEAFSLDTCVISQKSYDGASSSEKFDQVGLISAISQIVHELSEDVTTEEGENFHISQTIYDGASGQENIDANTLVESFVEYICVLQDLSIPPGGVLIVDAGNYNVLLNQENAIYYQSNDWLDDLNRLTQSFKVIADHPENLTASILYTERYL